METLIGSTVQNTHGAQFRVTDVGWVSAFFRPVLCVQLVELVEAPGHWEAPAPDQAVVSVPVESFLVQFITCPVQAQVAS